MFVARWPTLWSNSSDVRFTRIGCVVLNLLSLLGVLRSGLLASPFPWVQASSVRGLRLVVFSVLLNESAKLSRQFCSVRAWGQIRLTADKKHRRRIPWRAKVRSSAASIFFACEIRQSMKQISGQMWTKLRQWNILRTMKMNLKSRLGFWNAFSGLFSYGCVPLSTWFVERHFHAHFLFTWRSGPLCS